MIPTLYEPFRHWSEKGSVDIVNITLHFFLKDVRSMLPPAVNHSIAVS